MIESVHADLHMLAERWCGGVASPWPPAAVLGRLMEEGAGASAGAVFGSRIPLGVLPDRRMQRLRSAVWELPAELQALFAWHYLKRAAVGEIAQAAGVTRRHVYRRLHQLHVEVQGRVRAIRAREGWF